MATYRWKTNVYASDLFVESCGALVFDLSCPSNKRVCLLHLIQNDEWVLPKGRRNCNETRQAAAVREVREESGFVCKLRPVTMPTRAPSELEAADVQDAPRTYHGLTEPFMLEVRDLGKGNIKLVWWFMAEWDDEGGHGEPEVHFKSQFFDCDVAMNKLTFQKDRDVLLRALELAENSGW